MKPTRAGLLAVGSSLVVVALWFARRQPPRAETVTEATLALQITRHDAFGVPSKPATIREPRRVRAVLDDLGVEALATAPCPADYATADVGFLLTGRDVYARRNAYVWGLLDHAPRVVLVDETGCRAGDVLHAGRLRDELLK